MLWVLLGQAENDLAHDAENTHLVNIGTMVQTMENKMLGRTLRCARMACIYFVCVLCASTSY